MLSLQRAVVAEHELQASVDNDGAFRRDLAKPAAERGLARAAVCSITSSFPVLVQPDPVSNQIVALVWPSPRRVPYRSSVLVSLGKATHVWHTVAVLLWRVFGMLGPRRLRSAHKLSARELAQGAERQYFLPPRRIHILFTLLPLCHIPSYPRLPFFSCSLIAVGGMLACLGG